MQDGCLSPCHPTKRVVVIRCAKRGASDLIDVHGVNHQALHGQMKVGATLTAEATCPGCM